MACLLLAVLAVASAKVAVALDVPPLRGRVNDLARVLPPERAAALEQRLSQYEAETSHQIVLLTVPSLEGEPLESFALRVAEAWRPGQRKLDNGILIVVAPGERAARIEVGYGLEGSVPDAVAARILRDRMFPLFREERMADGIEEGTAAVMAAARGETIPEAQRPSDSRARSRQGDPLAVILFASFLGSLLAAPFRRGTARLVGALLGGAGAAALSFLLLASVGWALSAFPVGALFGWLGPAIGGGGVRRGGFGTGGIPGGGGFGGGGFSGGGGGFGGGGASGRW